MKKELIQIARTIADQNQSLTAIAKAYAGLLEKNYSQADARAIVDRAKEFKKADFARIDEKKAALVESINGELVLKAVFKEIQKDRRYKSLADKAYCKAGSVSELVSAWYPDTIDGEPARRVWNEGKTVRTWELKPVTKGNAASILITCIRNVAKAAKHQKSGTTKHEAGEVIEVVEAPAEA
jgi:hypothetical protein